MDKYPLIHIEGKISRIYFPSGKIKDGGTCSFATKKCLKECGSSTTNVREKYVYAFISQKNIFEICSRIYEEYIKSKTKLLQWFESGDCPKKDTNRIIEIIELLSKQKIPQFGFTRNRKLWEKVNEFDNVNFVLSVENRTRAENLSEKGCIAVPNYKTGKIKLYKSLEYVGSCGGAWYELEDVVLENNCYKCYEKNRGCFS